MRTKPSPCTACGVMLDAASMVDMHGETARERRFSIHEDVAPDPGKSFSVCIKCGHIMGFADDGTLRDLTPEEQVAIAGDPRLLAIQWAREKVMRRCPHGRPRMLCAECSTR